MTSLGRGLLIAGTSSDAGKSALVAGLCRALARRGVRVAPFKAQNMSNNSMVCRDGSEIGRAQYLQAQAAGVPAESAMNPVLLKPGTDRRAFVVVRGRPAGTLEAGEYATGRRHLAEAAFAAYQELQQRFDVVLAEGAGSPAEINLRSGDYVNMGLARRFDLPVVVVGDIDRGGVLASLYGTWALLEPADRGLLRAFVVNKFRGDATVLRPGLAEITRRTSIPFLGVLPWLEGLWIDGEDAYDVARWRTGSNGGPATGEPTAPPSDTSADRRLRVAVVRFPRISNTTDIDALAAEPGLDVVATTDPGVCAAADLLVLPGTRSTAADLAWLRERGLAAVVQRRAADRRAVLGICGGYQMLAHRIDDDVERAAGGIGTAGEQAGLGLLPTVVRFEPDKVLARPHGRWHGHEVHGYEIHHGRAVLDPALLVNRCRDEPDDQERAEEFLDGWRLGQVWGTMWHGTMENDAFRRAWLSAVARSCESPWRPDPLATGFGDRREAMLQTLADAVEEHLDLDRLLELTSPRLTPAADTGSIGRADQASGDACGDRVDQADQVDLDHHGDGDLGEGLVDLAVNVRLPRPPDWLVEALRAGIADLAGYPDPRPARQALAERHGVPDSMVLPTSGSAEAFTLIARALTPHAPLVVHPQFTETEKALVSAGRPPRRLLLNAESGFRLEPSQVDSGADLVLVGNPTNPTGVLHPAALLRRLCRPGRVVIVDEAFMDAVAGEPESLISADMPGLLVLRSLTKTWAVAGLRAGYLVGDPRLITRLADQQPPWSVSTLAALAMQLCSRPEAVAEAARAAIRRDEERVYFLSELSRIGIPVAGVPRTPFLLLDTGALGPDSPRPALRDLGFAVRRGETFPGLGPSWIRVAVRDRATTDAFVRALSTLCSEHRGPLPGLGVADH